MSKGLKLAAFLCAVMMVLASCGGKTEQTQTAQSGERKEANKELKLLFPQMIEREGEILAGGTLVCGLVGDTPWKGIFNTF